MEANTVCITLADYEQLKKFKETIENDGACMFHYSSWNDVNKKQYKFVSKNKMFKFHANEYKMMHDIVKSKKDYIDDLKNEIDTIKKTLTTLQGFSVRQFKTYKKNQ